MSQKQRKDAVNPEYPLERLRIERTEILKKDFPATFDKPYKTYEGWVEDDRYPELNFRRMKKLAEVVNMSLDELQEYIDNYAYQKY